MGHIAATVNGRTYQLACADGEEPRLKILLAYVKEKVESLRADLGDIDEARLLLMTAVVIADEMIESRGGRIAPQQPTAPEPASPPKQVLRAY